LRAPENHLAFSQTNTTSQTAGGIASFRWAELSLQQHNSLLAAGLSWLFSGFAVMLYSTLLPQIISALHMTKSAAGLLNALMLVATGLGSLAFGLFADRFGRKRALIYSILTFTTVTFLSGLATSVAGTRRLPFRSWTRHGRNGPTALRSSRVLALRRPRAPWALCRRLCRRLRVGGDYDGGCLLHC
jgi:hypothetical protein